MRASAASSLQSISLVRHADAGSRERFVGEDSLRPLSRRGRRQAEGISRRLAESYVGLASSPALRCVETLAPLSFRLHRAMTVTPLLAEGQEPGLALAYLLDALAGDAGIVACSHGDVITGIVELCSESGSAIEGTVNLEKGSTTELRVRDGKVQSVAFVAPPVR